MSLGIEQLRDAVLDLHYLKVHSICSHGHRYVGSFRFSQLHARIPPPALVGSRKSEAAPVKDLLAPVIYLANHHQHQSFKQYGTYLAEAERPHDVVDNESRLTSEPMDPLPSSQLPRGFEWR